MKLMSMHYPVKWAFWIIYQGFAYVCVLGGEWGGFQISPLLCLCRQPPVLS